MVVVQAEDLAASRKLIPNFETWSQCFALYAAVRISHKPTLTGDLMAYFYSIATMARKHPWPSWILYDQAFREEAAWMPERLCGKEDASLYAKCYTWGPIRSADPGCWNCQSFEHSSGMCPHKPPPKRVRRADPKADEPCRKYNNNDGRCTFGEKCKYQHKCQNCEGGHPLSRCPKLRRDHSNGNGRGSKTS